MLEHEIFKGYEKRNFLRKAGKSGLDLRDFYVLPDVYIGNKAMDVDPGNSLKLLLLRSNQYQGVQVCR